MYNIFFTKRNMQSLNDLIISNAPVNSLEDGVPEAHYDMFRDLVSSMWFFFLRETIVMPMYIFLAADISNWVTVYIFLVLSVSYRVIAI